VSGAAAAEDRLRGARILVVEDEPDLRGLLDRHLEQKVSELRQFRIEVASRLIRTVR